MKKLIRFTNAFESKDQIILRDHLALQRTKLANERTLLAYVRSSLYLIIAGIAFLEMEEFQHMHYVAEVCIGVSVLIFTIGVIRYWQLQKQLNKVYKEPKD